MVSRRTIAYILIMSFLSALVVTLAGIFYTSHVSHQNDLRWCKVLIAIDDAYTQSNIVSEAGRRIGREFHQLRIDFKC